MLKNYNVDIYNKATGQKVNGISIPGALTWVKNIYCDLQSYSTELLLKDYGWNIEVNKRIFIDYFDSDIKIGTVIKYENTQSIIESYEVKKFIPYSNHMEVFALGI